MPEPDYEMIENEAGAPDPEKVRRLAAAMQRRAPLDAATLLNHEDDATAAAVIGRLPTSFAAQVVQRMPEIRRAEILPQLQTESANTWWHNLSYPEDTVGRLMSAPVGTFAPDTTVREAVAGIRALAEHVFITYAYVVDADQRLVGVIVMRDLLLAEPGDLLSEIMVTEPYFFHPETPISDAMQAMVHRHYPVYPVCDKDQRLLGLVQGFMLFEEHAFELSAQSGRMVGVDREEHFNTPWLRCLQLRQPWLQLNLLTAFLAAAVVGSFEDTIAQVVALAVFLPVLAGQSGNTGVQSLAVTVRGLTLREYGTEALGRLLAKESLLGLWNGALVGLIAAGAMVVYAQVTETPHAVRLGITVFLAMVGSCVTSGMSGVLVPLGLKRLNLDPASASGIFVTTATDITSMGLFLGAATLLVL